MRERKGQIAIFIIVAILVVVAVTVIFLARSNTISIFTGEEFSPEGYMSSCVRDAAREKLAVMLPQGGVYNPTDYIVLNSTRVAYVCKNINYFQPCVNQYPRYITHLKEELRSLIEPDINDCLVALKTELESRQYTVTSDDPAAMVAFRPGAVDISVPLNLTLQKNGVTRNIETIASSLSVPVYDLGLVANEIVSQEAQYCYFEYVGYMILYPTYDIRVATQSDTTKIYTITHLPTGNVLRFATRGCAFPAGI